MLAFLVCRPLQQYPIRPCVFNSFMTTGRERFHITHASGVRQTKMSLVSRRIQSRDTKDNRTRECYCRPTFPNSSVTRGRYHGGRRPSSDDSFQSPTVIPPSALDKPSIMNRDHRRRMCSHTPTMVTLRDTRFVECRWWNDGYTLKTVVT